MHRLIAGVTILEHELSELRLLVERQTGVLLDCPNSALAAHVAEYLEAHELESPAALLERFRSTDLDPSTLSVFLDGVVNMKTGFFRHPGAMNALSRYVIPQLYERKANDGACTLRIWSAGCATGEEAYSIAMAICESMPNGNGNGSGNGSNGNGTREAKSVSRNGGISESTGVVTGQPMREWSIHIVGSDLLPSAIQAAERGLYPQSALQGLPPAMIRACQPFRTQSLALDPAGELGHCGERDVFVICGKGTFGTLAAHEAILLRCTLEPQQHGIPPRGWCDCRF